MSRPQAPKKMHRRDVVKLVPLALFGSALAGLTRALTACTEDVVQPARERATTPTPTPDVVKNTDDDEYVPPNGAPPVKATEGVPTLPNQAWDSRAKQLDADQVFRYTLAVFTATQPGPWKGKERSHVPGATVTTENNLKKVTVAVQHVMGKNALPPVDAGPYVDSGTKVDATVDAATNDAMSDAATADAAADAGAVDAAPPAPKPEAGPLPEHYITTIFIRGLFNGKDTVIGLWEFNSTDAAPPSVQFTIPPGVTEVTAWEWCTLHGLWRSDPIGL